MERDKKSSKPPVGKTGASKVYIGLLHYPVYNKNGETVSSAVTNLDIHDIARVAKTYDLSGYFIVTPDSRQRELVAKICGHWLEGYGASYNCDRGSALKLVKISSDIEEVVKEIEEEDGRVPLIAATSASIDASFKDKIISIKEAAGYVEEGDISMLILFGTGWGLAREILERSDIILSPVLGRENYNHLSVRSAAAIIVDRLLEKR
ncbi:MAG: RNA methyltransferase [bacterium]|nr:RNA methyltransferase [bacterium]